MTDEEKVAGVIEYQNKRYTLPINGKNPLQVKYNSVAEVLKENPNCCKIVKSGDVPPPNILDRISGNNSTDIIRVNYEVRYLDENGQTQTSMIDYYNTVTNCGKVLGD